ncbi:diguanylate cyclase [Eubacteriaceae bacterium ES3]|nr:diguanylate cyclase [Eubacteriaceae bacterium ES3]
MEKLLIMLGYSNQLEEKNKLAFIMAGVGLSQLLLFLIFYIIIAKSSLLVVETLVIIIMYLLVFVFLKKKYYTAAKALAVIALMIQVFLLVILWFPAETYFTFFFFLVPPISFFILDIEDPTELKVLIFLNSLAAIVVLLSSIIWPLELIELENEYIIVLRIMSTISTLVTEILVFYFYANSLAKTHAELRLLANTDALTNVSNRRVLFEQGEKLVSIHAKYRKTFTLMILDIDHFKEVNDKYGHPAGDVVLKEISKIISENIRKEDLVCRYGGEEFAVLYKNMDQNHRENIETIKKKVKDHKFMVDEESYLKLTFSAGVVTCNEDVVHFDELVKKADALLYQAKTSGRDQIVYDKNTI